MGTRVIVADSDRTTLELVTAVLTRDGFEILATPDGGDALARFYESEPALVICAEGLSSISGPELCRQIKAQSPETRVVILHGHGEGIESLGLAGELGCDAVLPTPFRYDELKKHLVQWEMISPAETGSDSVSFTVPTSEHFRLEMPPPLAPPNFDVADSTPTVPPSEEESAPVDIPPMTVPIPLPMEVSASSMEEDLPDLDLEEIGSGEESLPELVPEEVVATTGISLEPNWAPTIDGPTQGTLTDVPMPRLVYKLYLATFSGVLQLESSASKRDIYFWGGMPVRVDSSQIEEALGRMLLEHGRITVDQYTQSLELMRQNNCKQGEALIQLEAIDESDLLDALRQQTELKLCNSFAWREANYQIVPRTDFARDTVLSEVHPLKVIWRGVVEHYDLDSLLSFFVPLQQRYAVATELFPVYFATLGPFLRELQMAEHLDGQSTFAEVLQRGADQQLRMTQALYVLLVSDMVRPADKPGLAAKAPAAVSTVELGPTDPGEIARLADEIAAEYLRIKGSDYLDVLRVEPSSTPEEVDSAYTNILTSLKLEQLPAGMPDDVLRRAREIKDIFAKARMVVRDPNMRDRYLQEQQQQFSHSGLPSIESESDAASGAPAAAASLELDVGAGRVSIFEAQRHFSDGHGYMARGEFADAVVTYQKAVDANAGEPSYRVALGRAIWQAQKDKGEITRSRVVSCLQQALQIDPAHLEANLEMAKMLVEAGNRERAYAYVQRVLQRVPDHVEAKRLLASLG